MTPKVKVIILNWNQPQLTIDCIKSVDKIRYDNFEILVIDNGSDDNSINLLKKEFPNIEILSLDKNYKFAGAYNRAIDYISNQEIDYLLLLNNDTIVDSNLVQNFIKCIKCNPNSILGAKIYYLEDKIKLWYAGAKIKLNKGQIYHIGIGEIDSGQYDSTIETDYITGCCMFVSKEIFVSLRGFDTDFNMYCEDVDFCMRAYKLGYNSIYVHNCLVWHHVSASINHSNKILSQTSSIWKLIEKHLEDHSRYLALIKYLFSSIRKTILNLL